MVESNPNPLYPGLNMSETPSYGGARGGYHSRGGYRGRGGHPTRHHGDPRNPDPRYKAPRPVAPHLPTYDSMLSSSGFQGGTRYA